MNEPVRRTTRHIRVYEEQADKIGWLVDLGVLTSAASFFDEVAGARIDELYGTHAASIEAIKVLKAGAVSDVAFANELGEAGA